MMRQKTARRHGESGFALILAILSLMLLTFLGLTLAATTTTELQVAANYRWSQQALYNAEAGVEVAKIELRDVDWSTVLPPVRTGANVPWSIDGPYPAAVTPPSGTTRNCENGYADNCSGAAGCDKRGGQMGFGFVFSSGGFVGENFSAPFGFPLNGGFTIWVRRPLDVGNLIYQDKTGNDELIITSEGVAPGVSGIVANKAVRLLEMTVTRTPTTAQGFCGTRGGQAGGGAAGSGFGSCEAVTGSGLDDALGRAGTTENLNVK